MQWFRVLNETRSIEHSCFIMAGNLQPHTISWRKRKPCSIVHHRQRPMPWLSKTVLELSVKCQKCKYSLLNCKPGSNRSSVLHQIERNDLWQDYRPSSLNPTPLSHPSFAICDAFWYDVRLASKLPHQWSCRRLVIPSEQLNATLQLLPGSNQLGYSWTCLSSVCNIFGNDFLPIMKWTKSWPYVAKWKYLQCHSVLTT